MATMNQLKQSASEALDNLAEGWRRLWSQARQALTRFKPTRRSGDVEVAGSEWLKSTPEWSVLSAEVKEGKDTITVRLEVPGMEADDFDIQVVDDYLVIRGEKRWERDEEEGEYHLLERAYGSFERAIPLPKPVDESRAKAKYKRGVLTVTLPIAASHQQRRIAIE